MRRPSRWSLDARWLQLQAWKIWRSANSACFCFKVVWQYQLLTSSMISFAAFPWSFFYDSTEKIFASGCLPRGNLQRCKVWFLFFSKFSTLSGDIPHFNSMGPWFAMHHGRHLKFTSISHKTILTMPWLGCKQNCWCDINGAVGQYMYAYVDIHHISYLSYSYSIVSHILSAKSAHGYLLVVGVGVLFVSICSMTLALAFQLVIDKGPCLKRVDLRLFTCDRTMKGGLLSDYFVGDAWLRSVRGIAVCMYPTQSHRRICPVGQDFFHRVNMCRSSTVEG